jgi:hypothetical protein
MTEARWNVHRYTTPHLALHEIRSLDRAVELTSSSGTFRIGCEDTSAQETLQSTLEALRDPGSPLWGAIRDRAPGTAELAMLIQQMDHLGMIRDHGTLDADVDVSARAAERAVHAWSAELGQVLAARGEPASALAETLAARMDAPAAELEDLIKETNFAVLTLLFQAHYLRGNAPVVHWLLVTGLRAAVRWAAAGGQGDWWTPLGEPPPSARDEWTSGLVDPAVVDRYLATTGSILRDAFGSGANRRARPTCAPAEPMSGINFVVELEGEVMRILAQLGPSPALTTSTDAVLARRVIRAAFLQEYLVTCRFVECIAPLLSRRFPAALRATVHRYFFEEVGHEQFERENCLHLGLAEHEVDGAKLLPYHLAFVDILTAMASSWPFAFFCASMFTEGIIGTSDSLQSLAQQALPDDPVLVAALGDHVSVNDEVGHRAMGRDWMCHVPRVTERVQRALAELAAYFAELNWRMWDQLVQSCREA